MESVTVMELFVKVILEIMTWYGEVSKLFVRDSVYIERKGIIQFCRIIFEIW